MRKIDPKVKAIVASGYSNDPIMADFAKHGFDGVVTKPYGIEKLSEVIHKVMSNQAHANCDDNTTWGSSARPGDASDQTDK